ncbi:long-chain fatty acid transporter [Sulfurifustis variabilis]|uniref:Long-chain fatty acid transporter n=1 Tax=Sulfurifustis variabilis TaxID=1675686 RepID=A0A1B4V9Y1_9GAMM|nr:outer membrane protein transport protein [Sulfurifustis variabilis]BAU50389.1 long-chain fatty acid transporter [Sulfurifustis variabilis]
MRTTISRTRYARAILAGTAATLVFVAAPVRAAFFQLAENSPAGLGNAFAGGAAIAEDASTVWYNPAGLTRLTGTQLVVGGHFIQPSLEFNGSASTAIPSPITGSDGGDAGESAFVPNLYLSHQYGNGISTGIGINAPFGLATDYENDWVGRYHADRSEIRTININPAIAYTVNEIFSIGAGLNWQRLDAELSQAVDFGTICGGFCGAPAGNDGKAKVEADDDAWGYNLGLLWQVRDNTRLGLHYRSKLDFTVEGDFDITVPASAAAVLPLSTLGLVDSGASSDVTLPATLSLSAFTQLNPAWAIMADITRTYWSDLPELRIEFDSNQQDSVVTLDLEDVNRYSAGVIYSPGGAWIYRAGVALDKTPTPSADVRTPRLPDEDRRWISLGIGYKVSERLSFDAAFTYIGIEDAKVNKSATLAATDENRFRGNLVGEYEASTTILSAQARWNF